MDHNRKSSLSETGSESSTNNDVKNISGPVPPVPQRSPSSSSLHKSIASHRPSFAENLRSPGPPSPRAQRHPSFSQSSVHELINNPPPTRPANPRFVGRDWRDVKLGELLSEEDDGVEWVELDTSVEDATKALLKPRSVNVVLIREDKTSHRAVSYFDYNDLNAYVLAVVGLAKPEDTQVALYDSLATRAQDRVAIPLHDIQAICHHEQLVLLQIHDPLPKAIELFGSGVHRVLLADASTSVVGVVSQLKVMEFFWNEGLQFTSIERLYTIPLRDLQVGTQQIIAINADSPLAEALVLMSNEGLTSIAVVDNGLNVLGNISLVDVRLLTSAASLPLLQDSCMHFITVILSERGMEKGRDSVPVFYVNPQSTLAHTVAKLVATKSHRMWVVEGGPSPASSAPQTPLLGPIGATSHYSGGEGYAADADKMGSTILMPSTSSTSTIASTPPSPLPMSSFPTAVPASAMAGAHMSGRLTGVVSLTDILNLFARSSGLHPSDPGEQRAMRRKSSSSSVRPSMDGSRASLDVRR